jgi:ataxin-10
LILPISSISDGGFSADEVVTPHQTTLLKLLDAYLQPSNLSGADVLANRLTGLCKLLTTKFFSLTNYAQESIRRALDSNKSRSQSNSLVTPCDNRPGVETHASASGRLSEHGHLNELDLLLPKVCEALVLVTQGLVSLALFSEEMLNSKSPTVRTDDLPSYPMETRFKDKMNCAVSEQGVGLVEALIGSCVFTALTYYQILVAEWMGMARNSPFIGFISS